MKIVIVIGTRPDAIKLAPLIWKLGSHFDVKVVSSGQHFELLDQVLRLFKITPDHKLKCMPTRPDVLKSSICIQTEFSEILDIEDPELVIVQGDTVTAYSAAYTAFIHKKPVFHVEAGLRTYRKFAPFPEEIFRELIARLCDFHFAPTKRAAENLIREGVREDRILVTGNTIVDAMIMLKELINKTEVFNELARYDSISLKLPKKKTVLVTLHRRENIGRPMFEILEAIKELAYIYQDTYFIYPMHKNPDVREIAYNVLKERPNNIIVTEPLSYQTFIYVLERSDIILTDSGGVQEEAAAFNKPVLILRDVTERPEIIEAGFGFITGSSRENIIAKFKEIYAVKFKGVFSINRNPFGDGRASERILEFLSSSEIQNFIERYPETAGDEIKYKSKVMEFVF